MGFAKNQLIDEQENFRDCPECGESCRVNWKDSPQFECTNCEFTGDISECERCSATVSNDDVLCENCLTHYENE